MELSSCPLCHATTPLWVIQVKNGRCMSCDMIIYTKGKWIIPFIGKEGYCQHCYTKLVPIGNARKNGVSHDDWEDRKYHKTCYKQIMKDN